MGMYDMVKCAYKLPDPEIQDHEFQTKCLDSLMFSYRISREGQLYKLCSQNEWVEDDSLLGGHTESLNKWEEKMGLTGSVDMYSSIDSEWYEYRLLFKEGMVVDAFRIYEDID